MWVRGGDSRGRGRDGWCGGTRHILERAREEEELVEIVAEGVGVRSGGIMLEATGVGEALRGKTVHEALILGNWTLG